MTRKEVPRPMESIQLTISEYDELMGVIRGAYTVEGFVDDLYYPASPRFIYSYMSLRMLGLEHRQSLIVSEKLDGQTCYLDMEVPYAVLGLIKPKSAATLILSGGDVDELHSVQESLTNSNQDMHPEERLNRLGLFFRLRALPDNQYPYQEALNEALKDSNFESGAEDILNLKKEFDDSYFIRRGEYMTDWF